MLDEGDNNKIPASYEHDIILFYLLGLNAQIMSEESETESAPILYFFLTHAEALERVVLSLTLKKSREF